MIEKLRAEIGKILMEVCYSRYEKPADVSELDGEVDSIIAAIDKYHSLPIADGQFAPPETAQQLKALKNIIVVVTKKMVCERCGTIVEDRCKKYGVQMWTPACCNAYMQAFSFEENEYDVVDFESTRRIIARRPWWHFWKKIT